MTDSPSAGRKLDITPMMSIFSSPMMIRQNSQVHTDLLEDIHQCLRLAQLVAQSQYDNERQAKEWFANFLETLVGLDFNLFEHTKRTIPYTYSQDVLNDVFEGWLPAPQAPNTRFRSITREVINQLSSEDKLYRRSGTSSHLSIELDSDDGETFVAILFHVFCTKAPDISKTRLNLEFDHLGAMFDSTAFEAQRAMVQSRLQQFAEPYLQALDL
ncbi:hypothetical protein ACYU03_01935 [Pseudomonas sp. X10]